MTFSLTDAVLSHDTVDYTSPRPRGRFAPSPSGRMHLGNVYAALMSYLSVRTRGGEWLLRIEDIDPQRSRSSHAQMIMDDLHWLGMWWDDEPVYQSLRNDCYMEYLQKLSDKGYLYPCICTRAELHSANAPHASDGTLIYDGHCRPTDLLYDITLEGNTLRVRTDSVAGDSTIVEFTDALSGIHRVDVASEFGDFIVRRRDGAWAYQFAVTVDDALMGITEVVRGDDLLSSTAPQRYLAQILGLTSPRRYLHLPLLRNSDGIRLSKRDGSLSMDNLRSNYSPHQVIEMICTSCGLPLDRVLPYLHFC